MPKVSVIVPIYEAEHTIRRFIDSLLAQTMSDFELLLIDDGSPDRCGEICDEYARNDSRIRVFHKENGGVATARQMGIDYATGEYSIHADPDDWVESTMLEELYKEAKEKEADMVICDFWEHENDKIKYSNQCPNSLDSKELFREYFSPTKMHGSTCNKLIRTNLYKDYDVQFLPNMTFLEDLFVVCQLLLHELKITYLPKAFYHYIINYNSTSLSININAKALQSFYYFIDYFEGILPPKEYSEELFRRKLRCKEYMWYRSKCERKEIIGKYKEINKEFIKRYNNGLYPSSKTLYLALTNRYYLARFIQFISKSRNTLHNISHYFHA